MGTWDQLVTLFFVTVKNPFDVDTAIKQSLTCAMWDESIYHSFMGKRNHRQILVQGTQCGGISVEKHAQQTHWGITIPQGLINTLRLRQNGRHFPDDIFKCIFLNERVLILIKISLKFVPRGPINNIPALVQIMAWHHPGDKPLSEPMMVSLTTHVCVTQPQWVNSLDPGR